MIRAAMRRVRSALGRRLGDRAGLLSEGELAPDWVLRDADGCLHAAGARWQVLLVAPSNVDPWLRALAETKALDVSVHVLAPRATPLPTLIDPDGTVTRRFGAVPRRPATFLVNPAGKIRMSQESTAPPSAVLRSIQALREAAPERM